MGDLRKNGSTSNRVRFTLKDKTTGQGKTGLSISTSGLIISTICDNESAAVAYTQAGSTIETIATLGTFATPTATKCRFKEVDSTNNKGLYEFQFANARFAVSGAGRLVISVSDAESTILDADYEVDLQAIASVASSTLDEVNTGATHNVNNSLGKQVRLINPNSDAIYPTSGTVNLTAATSTTATLDASASAVSQVYQYDVLNILTGTGAGQSRPITNYTTGRVATVSPAFTTTPDTSSTFDITPTASVQVLSYIAGQDPATLTWAAATRTLTALPAITADWLSAAGVSAAAVTKIQAGLATPTNITAGTITTTTNLTNAPTSGDLTAAMKASITTAATAATPTVTAGTVTDKAGYSLAVAPPTAIAIADACLIRDWTAVVGTVPTRSTLNALRFLRNKWTLSGSTLTVFDEAGGTAWTSIVTATAGADPVTATNPS